MTQLVLIRHGQSAWNLENRFTGWWDVPVTAAGAEEARAAGRALAAHGFAFDIAFTSVLTRAIQTLNLVLGELDTQWLPVTKDWRLNERHYGGLTGLNKAETAALHGEAQVHTWRRSFDVPPPPEAQGSPFAVAADRRYAGITVPTTESLKDTIARVLPYWETAILPELQCGQARAGCRARQQPARAGETPLGYQRRGDRVAGNPDRPPDRLLARRQPARHRAALFG